MFDSPVAPCRVCGQMVLLDQTQRECAVDHRCGNIQCPLAEIFSGIDFSVTPPGQEPKHERSQ